jgi:glycosyltransferase involved in cell wall biosynthesis
MPFTHKPGAGLLSLLWEYLGFTLVASLRVGMQALRERYEVVQVHNPPDFLILAGIMPKLFGARLILDIHDFSSDMFAMRFENRRGTKVMERALRAIEAWATRRAHAIITVHEPYRRELLVRGVPAQKTSVVMNSVDERLLPAVHRGADHRHGFRVVYHGTITPSYGVQLLVEAASLLADEIPDLSVEIYGQGDSLPQVLSLARELGVADRVHLSGRFLPQVEVLARVQGANVGVIPNLANRLNRFALSSKLFEYVALGIPVVCSDLPTFREHFGETEMLFFTPGDRESLAEAFLAVWRDEAAALARAAAALRRYKHEYSWIGNARRYAAVLDALAPVGVLLPER